MSSRYNLRSRGTTTSIESESDEGEYESEIEEENDTEEKSGSETIGESDDEGEYESESGSELDEGEYEGSSETEFSGRELAEMIANRVKKRAEEIFADADEDWLDDGEYNGYLDSPYLLGEWKRDVKDIKEEDEKEIQEKLDKYIEEMRRELPSIDKILTANISERDKKECIYLLDLVKNTDSHDPLFQEYRKKLIKKMKPKTKKQLELERLFTHDTSYETRILNLDTSDENKTTLLYMVNSLGDTNDSEKEAKISKLESYLRLPYNKKVVPLSDKMQPNKFLMQCSELLDKELYGMDNVKRKFLSEMSKRMLQPNEKGCAICLCGPPGVGKTHISRIFAKCLGLPYYEMSLGGAKDSTVLTGGDNQWVGTSCGRILYAMQEMQCSNGVLFMDELDKVSDTCKDMFNTINHITDFTSNKKFSDDFLKEIKHDISGMWLIMAINDKHLLPDYLRSRLIIFDVPAYDSKEKSIIAKKHLIPKFLRSGCDVTFNDDAISSIIRMSKEKGVREISNIIEHVCSKIDMHILMADNIESNRHCQLKHFKLPYVITSDDIRILANDLKSSKEELPESAKRMFM